MATKKTAAARKPRKASKNSAGKNGRKSTKKPSAEQPTRQSQDGEPVAPPGLLESLGLVGMQAIEPVVLAALISGEPLLLIGRHGTAKSYLLARICQAMRLEWRHYNASLLNYDDLVGYPLPDGDGKLQFVETPASIWGAEAVFLDEISRCRIDLQNKLFPIIHERRVQGIELPDLQFRWAAMNPPVSDFGDGLETDYLGSQPLDTALADRFAFIIVTPDWDDLVEEERRAVVTGSGQPIDPAAARQLRQLVEAGRGLVDAVTDEMLVRLAHYVQLVNDLLRTAAKWGLKARGAADDDDVQITLSPRRAAMIARNIVAVHVAAMVLEDNPEIGNSALLALRHSIPQRAQGVSVSSMKLAAAHREAWKLAELPSLDPKRFLAMEADPVRRAQVASQLGGLTKPELSTIIADAISSLPPGGRHALGVWAIDSGLAGRMVAAIAEQCAALMALVAVSRGVDQRVHGHGTQHSLWKSMKRRLGRLKKNAADTPLLTNLLMGLFVQDELATEDDVDDVVKSWKAVRDQLNAGLEDVITTGGQP